MTVKMKRVYAGVYRVKHNGADIGEVRREGFGNGWRNEWIYRTSGGYSNRKRTLKDMTAYLTEILEGEVKL